MPALPPPPPENPWDLIPLGEQFDNHDEYMPPRIDLLAGRTLRLHPEDGRSPIAIVFGTHDVVLDAELVTGWGAGSLVYDAFDLRAPGIIGVVAGDLAARRSLLLVLDLDGGRALGNASELVAPDGGPLREQTTYPQFGVDRPLDRPFQRTTALVGHRIHQRYSTTHAFEHIHLNPGLYAFHCIEGPEAGIGDVDKADYFEIADRLYLFSWHERQQPFNGAVLTDLARGTSRGRLFGWDAATASALQIRTGSISTVLNVTRYDGV